VVLYFLLVAVALLALTWSIGAGARVRDWARSCASAAAGPDLAQHHEQLARVIETRGAGSSSKRNSAPGAGLRFGSRAQH